MEYASKAVGTAGLTTGIIGTALGALGGGLSMINGGNGGGLLGGSSNGRSAIAEDQFVTRYELDMQNKLMEKDREIAILTSEQNTEIKIADVYERVMAKVNQNQKDQSDWNAAQSVANSQMTAAIATNANSISGLESILNSVNKVVILNSDVCPGWGPVSITGQTVSGCGCSGSGTTIA